MKRILQVERPIRFTVAVEVDDGELGRVKVLTSASESRLLLEQAAAAMTLPAGLLPDEKRAVGVKS